MSNTSDIPYRPDPFKPVPEPPEIEAARAAYKQQQLHDTRYKTFWRRFGAGLIDGFVWAPFFLVILAAMAYSESRDAPWVYVLTMICISTVSHSYVVGMHARFGKTIGKMTAGVTVVDAASHGPISVWQALRRSSGDIALSVAAAVSLTVGANRDPWEPSNGGFADTIQEVGVWLWFGIEMLTFWTNSRRRAFHDLIAGTVVVKTAWLDHARTAAASPWPMAPTPSADPDPASQ